jgi:hypothetical protein
MDEAEELMGCWLMPVFTRIPGKSIQRWEIIEKYGWKGPSGKSREAAQNPDTGKTR